MENVRTNATTEFPRSTADLKEALSTIHEVSRLVSLR